MIDSIILLGSTGSVGTQVLEVASHLGIKIEALSGNSNHILLEQQCRKYSPSLCWIGEQSYKSLRTALADTNIKVLTGEEGLLELITVGKSKLIFNSLLGISGLKPTITAIRTGKNIALANKETLVAGGSFVMAEAKQKGVEIIPVDSEHSAIFQCLQGQQKPKKVILTASGGSFYGRSKESLKDVTVEETLNHPNWDMGAKITVDSATLMNKGLEFIEAAHLFGLSSDRIDVIIHRESIIHSMVEFDDGSVLAQLGMPDMRGPIQYALTYPERRDSLVESINFCKIGKLSFDEPDYEVFPLLRLAKKAYELGGGLPAVLNGSNEAAVGMFLKGKISFLEISKLVTLAVESYDNRELTSLDDVFHGDLWARHFVQGLVQ